jgi:hypothetical protein
MSHPSPSTRTALSGRETWLGPGLLRRSPSTTPASGGASPALGSLGLGQRSQDWRLESFMSRTPKFIRRIGWICLILITIGLAVLAGLASKQYPAVASLAGVFIGGIIAGSVSWVVGPRVQRNIRRESQAEEALSKLLQELLEKALPFCVGALNDYCSHNVTRASNRLKIASVIAERVRLLVVAVNDMKLAEECESWRRKVEDTSLALVRAAPYLEYGPEGEMLWLQRRLGAHPTSRESRSVSHLTIADRFGEENKTLGLRLRLRIRPDWLESESLSDLRTADRCISELFDQTCHLVRHVMMKMNMPLPDFLQEGYAWRASGRAWHVAGQPSREAFDAMLKGLAEGVSSS